MSAIDEKRAKMLAQLERMRAAKRLKEEQRKQNGESVIRIGKRMREALAEKVMAEVSREHVSTGVMDKEQKQVVDAFVSQENEKLEKLTKQGGNDRDFQRFFQRQDQLLSTLVGEIKEIKEMKKAKRAPKAEATPPAPKPEATPSPPPKEETTFTSRFA